LPHFYRSSDEFVTAARATVAAGVPRQPVALLVAEVDPVEDPGAAVAATESRYGAVAEIIRHTLRSDDHVGWVDDLLVMVLAGATAEDGRSVAERICAAVRIHSFGNGLGQITLSIGSASAPEHGNSFESVLRSAKTALVPWPRRCHTMKRSIARSRSTVSPAAYKSWHR
jgi:hypothetical protein